MLIFKKTWQAGQFAHFICMTLILGNFLLIKYFLSDILSDIKTFFYTFLWENSLLDVTTVGKLRILQLQMSKCQKKKDHLGGLYCWFLDGFSFLEGFSWLKICTTLLAGLVCKCKKNAKIAHFYLETQKINQCLDKSVQSMLSQLRENWGPLALGGFFAGYSMRFSIFEGAQLIKKSQNITNWLSLEW